MMQYILKQNGTTTSLAINEWNRALREASYDWGNPSERSIMNWLVAFPV